MIRSIVRGNDGNMLQYRSKEYVQRGYGIGGIFRGLARFLAPAGRAVGKVAKSVARVGKEVLKNPSVKKVLDVVADETIRTLTDATASAIAGTESNFDTNFAQGRKRVAEAVREFKPFPNEEASVQSGKGKGKKRKRERDDIFSLISKRKT